MWLAKHWMNYNWALWFDPNFFWMPIAETYADPYRYLPSSAHIVWLYIVYLQHHYLIVTHSLGAFHLFQSLRLPDPPHFHTVFGASILLLGCKPLFLFHSSVHDCPLSFHVWIIWATPGAAVEDQVHQSSSRMEAWLTIVDEHQDVLK